MLTERQIKILMLVHELEKSLGDLYKQFAKSFPKQNSFWKNMSLEEDTHADAVRKLYQLSNQGQSLFDEGSIKLEAIQSIVDYVKESIATAKQERFSAVRAVSVAYDLEKSLIEKEIFSHFKVAQELSEILQVLRKGSQLHLRLVKTELDKIQAAAMK